YSERTAQEIDDEVRRIVEEAYHKARNLLTTNIDALHRLAEALLVYETLEGDDVDKIVRGQEIGRPPPLETRLVAPPAEEPEIKPDGDKPDKVPPKPEPEPGMA
ncbi:MAG: cell division protein FtsH, partial [Deltaproteobacteria bacterium]